MANTLKDTVQNGKSAVRNAENAATAKARQAKNAIDDKLESNTLENMAETAGRRLHQLQTEAETAFANSKDYAETTVKNRPLMSLGVAFLAGAVVSKLLRR